VRPPCSPAWAIEQPRDTHAAPAAKKNRKRSPRAPACSLASTGHSAEVGPSLEGGPASIGEAPRWEPGCRSESTMSSDADAVYIRTAKRTRPRCVSRKTEERTQPQTETKNPATESFSVAVFCFPFPRKTWKSWKEIMTISGPTQKQVDYLASLIGASRDWEVERYVGDVVGKSRTKVSPKPLTKGDYSKAINHAKVQP